MSKNILISGALGFIGSYSIDKFHSKGWKIDAVDNKCSNAINKVPEGVVFHECSISDFNYTKHGPYDIILHLASPVGPAGVLKWAGKMGHQIIDDVQWGINAALYHNAHLIFYSTSEIYGYRDSISELSENDDKVLSGKYTVRNEYAIGKLLSEIILSNTYKQTKQDLESKTLRYSIIRPFNIAGARQQPDGGFVLPRFVKQALNNENITVFGDGSQQRAFTHVEDIVDGVYKIIESEIENEDWCVGNPLNRTSILEIAEKVIKITNSESKIEFVNPKEIYGSLYEEAYDKIPDSSKLRRLTGWYPKWSIDEIIRDVVEYWRDKNDKNN